ncbi:MAG: cellulase family glycosylhydrolase [Chloroflexi bacterium]|nr:cellulase family glycosylhydrolase [Chloroflexota bacterium]
MRRWNLYVGTGAIVALILSVLLALDLSQHGLAWRAAWALTGEEEPLSQVRGVVEWLGNATRAMPRTDPYAAVKHVHTSPFGINTFLQLEADPAVRERSMQEIAAAGFTYIRQQFPWQDIEIHGRGDFEDRRNVDAIGVVNAWDKYDQIVGLAETYGIQIQARVDTPPEWSRSDPNEGTLAPPDDWNDYYTFLRLVAERYAGRIFHYQIWNEPNIYPEWGNNPVNPEAYAEVLCRAYEVLKSVDPQIVVHAAALSPTVALTERDLSDLIFLQRMYDAGFSGCFDVMSVQGYGFYSGPTDQRLRAVTLNYGRPQYIRDLMVANGDANVPVWISEAAWNPVGEPDVPEIPGKENFGSVTEEQAARYMPLAFERATREWNWIGVIMYWYWKRPDESERGQPFYYFRMVEPDFTPLPVYGAMRDYIASAPPVLYRGTHAAMHRFIEAEGVAETAAGSRFSPVLRTSSAVFEAEGTHVLIRWQGGDRLRVSMDGGTAGEYALRPDAEGWTTSIVHRSLIPERHAFTVESDAPFLLDSVSVFDRTLVQLMPPLAAVLVVIVAELLLVGSMLVAGRRRRSNPDEAMR